jgi:CRP/FNR family cyclic AMP-dependent transcriptional regulator
MLLPLHEEVRLLSLTEILETLSKEDLEELARRNQDVTLEEGALLFTPGEADTKLFMIKRGRLRLYKIGPRGEEITLTFLDAGDIFGEMALTAQRLGDVYAQAAEPSLLIALTRESLEDLILDKPEVGLRLIKQLSERVLLLEDRLRDVTFKEVPARLASIILHLVESEGVKTGEDYEIPRHYTHDLLGSMIGANRVSVTKAFRTLRAAGAVELKDRKIHVEDLQALGRMAGEERRAREIANRLR